MIRNLRLLQFRCYPSLTIDLPARGAIFAGANAQGKTSILEAICMLVRLQSPRSKRTRTMLQLGEKHFGIAGDCWQMERKIRYERGVLEMEVDGEEVATRQHYFNEGGLIVWMGNDDLALIRGSGEVRRRYIDFLGCQFEAEYRKAIGTYRKALKIRNLLLKDSRKRVAEIAAYDGVLIESGDYITSTRASLIHMLEPYVDQAQQFLGTSQERIRME